MERSEEFLKNLGPDQITDDERVADNRRRRAEMLQTPLTDDERRLQQAYLDGIRERAALGAQMRARDRRLAQAEISRDAGFDTLRALLSLPVAMRMPTFDEQFSHAMLAVARGLFVLGFFEEARMFAGPDESLVAVVEMYADAAAEVDLREPCACVPDVVETQGDLGGGRTGRRAVENPNEFREAEFPHPKLRRWVHALRCVKCYRLRMTTELSESAARSRAALETPAADYEALAPRKE